MITALDRLSAAVKGETCDRIPIFCNLIDQGAKELGLTPQEYFSRGEHVAEGQVRLLRKYGHDNVWSLFYVGKEAELLGCRKILFSLDGPPNVEEFVIRTWDDVAKLQIPADVLGHPAFAEVKKCLEILRREVGAQNPICAYVTSAMSLPALLMGMEKWMELLFLGPADVRDELLGKCHELFVKEVAAYRQAGANVLVYSNPFGSTDTVPMKFFQKQSLPWIERDIRAVGPEGLVYYCGMSRLNKTLDAVLERTGLGAYYLSPWDNVVDGKRIIAGRGLACGVINDIRMIDWSCEQVRQEVKRIVEAGLPGGRFLFGTGVMPSSIPERNIRALLEAAFEFGRHEGNAKGRLPARDE